MEYWFINPVERGEEKKDTDFFFFSSVVVQTLGLNIRQVLCQPL